MDDLISRQAAIDAVIEITYDQTALHHGWVNPYYVVNRLEYLPIAEPDVIHCKECVYYENETHGLCDLGGEWAPDDYCSYGRRPKHG